MLSETEKKILDVLADGELKTHSVAFRADIGDATARKYLAQLAEAGEIVSDKVRIRRLGQTRYEHWHRIA